MNLQFFLEKLHSSEIFKKFIKENPSAFLCSGFFVIDKTGKEGNKQHFDYYVPKIKKMFSFKMEIEIEKVPIEDFGNKFLLKKIKNDVDFNFEEFEEIVNKKMQEEKINKKVEKILWSLQEEGGEDFLLGTVFISGLGLLKVKIDIFKKKIFEFEKKSFFDMMKIIKKKK